MLNSARACGIVAWGFMPQILEREVRTWTAVAVVEVRAGYLYVVRISATGGRLFSDLFFCANLWDHCPFPKLHCIEMSMHRYRVGQWHFYALFPPVPCLLS